MSPITAEPVTDLPAPEFADDAQHLAGRDVEGDTVDGLEHAAPRHELDAKVADGKDGLGHRRAIAGSGTPDQSAVI